MGKRIDVCMYVKERRRKKKTRKEVLMLYAAQ